MSLPAPGLDDIRVRFVTFRDTAADGRAAAAAAFADARAAERVVLETCHRVELVSVCEDATIREGQVLSGADAAARVFDVIAGFESAVVAEEQILSQARIAYEDAMARRTSGPVLNELFRRALRFGRHVRSHALPGTDRSLADRAVGWLAERLPPSGARVAVVGTGEMGRLLAHGLASRAHTVTIVSGSRERAERLVESLPGAGHAARLGPVDRGVAGAADALAIAVRGGAMRLAPWDLDETALPWTVDLSAPGSVEPEAAVLLGDRLATLDHLGESTRGQSALDPRVERRLRAEVRGEVERFAAWLETRRGADALALLRGEADAIRERHVQRLRQRSLLTDAQLAAVDATAAAMVAELLHGPSVRLRHGDPDAALVRRLFGIER